MFEGKTVITPLPLEAQLTPWNVGEAQEARSLRDPVWVAAYSTPLGWGRCDVRAFRDCAVEGGGGTGRPSGTHGVAAAAPPDGWGEVGAEGARAFLPLSAPESGNPVISCQLVPSAFGLEEPRAEVTDLGRLEREHRAETPAWQFATGHHHEPSFLTSGGPFHFLLHISGLKVGATQTLPGWPQSQRLGCVGREGHAPASGNENQQSRECGPVCAPDTKRAEVGRGAQRSFLCPSCLSPLAVGIPGRTLRIPTQPGVRPPS